MHGTQCRRNAQPRGRRDNGLSCCLYVHKAAPLPLPCSFPSLPISLADGAGACMMLAVQLLLSCGEVQVTGVVLGAMRRARLLRCVG